MGSALAHLIASGASNFSLATVHNGPQRKTPAPNAGPGSLAGWVRGWGLGGTPPGVGESTRRRARGSYRGIIFGRPPAPRSGGGSSACAAPGQLAVPHAGRRETRGSANGCEDAPGLHRSPPPRNACRLGTGWGDHLRTIPSQSSSKATTRLELAAINAG
jgi:hypothetical protein